uniref:DUF2807 domain-containing protein n=1 Tax=Panagrellus redivivus TaxID=6233 RepID=A0A7E4V9G5_PANRE
MAQLWIFAAIIIAISLFTPSWGHRRRWKRQALPFDNVQVHSYDSNITIEEEVNVRSSASRIELIETHYGANIWSQSSFLHFNPNDEYVNLTAQQSIARFNLNSALFHSFAELYELSEVTNRQTDKETQLVINLLTNVNLSLSDTTTVTRVEAINGNKAAIVANSWNNEVPRKLTLESSILHELLRTLVITSVSTEYNVVITLDGAKVGLLYGQVRLDIAPDYRSLVLTTESHKVTLKTVTSPFDLTITEENLVIRAPDDNTVLQIKPNSSNVDITVHQLSQLTMDRFGGSGLMLQGANVSTAQAELLELDSKELLLNLISSESDNNNQVAEIRSNSTNSRLKMQTNVTRVALTAGHHLVQILGGMPHLLLTTGNISLEIEGHTEGLTAVTLMPPFVMPGDQFGAIGPYGNESYAGPIGMPMTDDESISSSSGIGNGNDETSVEVNTVNPNESANNGGGTTIGGSGGNTQTDNPGSTVGPGGNNDPGNVEPGTSEPIDNGAGSGSFTTGENTSLRPTTPSPNAGTTASGLSTAESNTDEAQSTTASNANEASSTNPINTNPTQNTGGDTTISPNLTPSPNDDGTSIDPSFPRPSDLPIIPGHNVDGTDDTPATTDTFIIGQYGTEATTPTIEGFPIFATISNIELREERASFTDDFPRPPSTISPQNSTAIFLISTSTPLRMLRDNGIAENTDMMKVNVRVGRSVSIESDDFMDAIELGLTTLIKSALSTEDSPTRFKRTIVNDANVRIHDVERSSIDPEIATIKFYVDRQDYFNDLPFLASKLNAFGHEVLSDNIKQEVVSAVEITSKDWNLRVPIIAVGSALAISIMVLFFMFCIVFKEKTFQKYLNRHKTEVLPYN